MDVWPGRYFSFCVQIEKTYFDLNLSQVECFDNKSVSMNFDINLSV